LSKVVYNTIKQNRSGAKNDDLELCCAANAAAADHNVSAIAALSPSPTACRRHAGVDFCTPAIARFPQCSLQWSV